MTLTDFWNGIGNIFNQLFSVLESLGNGPNAILWVLIFLLLCFWIWRMGKYNKEADKNGTLK